MKTCTKCRVEKDGAEFGKSANAWDGMKPRCKECAKEDRAIWNAKNPEYFQQYYKNNSERIKARIAKRAKTLDKAELKQYFRDYYRNERREAIQRTAQWRKDNPGRYRAQTCKRMGADIASLVAWRNVFLINEIYDLAYRRVALTQTKWHVDHIVPIISKLVCGLHVEHNLAVIPARENIEKGNRRWPDMP